MEFIIYDIESKEILQVIGGMTVDKEYMDFLDLPAGQAYFAGRADPLTQYVDAWDVPGTGLWPMLLDKEPVPFEVNKYSVLADDKDSLIISGLLPGSAVIVDCLSDYPVADGGSLEITFDTPGTYFVGIICPNYLPEKFEVAAL